MMESNSVFIVGFVLVLALLILLFYRRNISALKTEHLERCDTLSNCYNKHRDQIHTRQMLLGNYDFQRFNLEQVLQEQAQLHCT